MDVWSEVCIDGCVGVLCRVLHQSFSKVICTLGSHTRIPAL